MARPFRYTLILVLVAIGTALAAVGGWRYARASAPVNGPIVLVSIDTLRADHLGAYGYTRGRTPALDALAADGVLFDRAYAQAPQTLPAHAALLSGRFPVDLGVRGDERSAIKAGERLLPQLLRERGFATAGIVSAGVLAKPSGVAQGFDFFDAEMPPFAPDTPVERIRRAGAESETVAEHWLDTVGTSRAFLFLHLDEPHAPYAAIAATHSELAPYDAGVAAADDIVGRLVRYLKSHQLYDRTTLVLVSDHGEGLGDHGEQQHGVLLYDESLHVPLIIKQAGALGAGRRVTGVVEQVDIVPTILDLVKAPLPGGLRGQSLKPVLEGTGAAADRAAYAESGSLLDRYGWSNLASLSDDKYRYIRAPREELYDRASDARERANRVTERPHELKRLSESLDRLLRTPAPAEKRRPGELDMARLEALGYAPIATKGEEPPADPKDKLSALARYLEARSLAADHRSAEAIAALQQVVALEPAMYDAWRQLALAAARIDRSDLALEAFRHCIELQPFDARSLVGAADVLTRTWQLDEAEQHAELAASVARADVLTAGDAHAVLARIALARGDADAARKQAALAATASPSLATDAYVNGRLLYDEGQFELAMPVFARAAAEQKARGGRQSAGLWFYAGDCAIRLERYEEAEKYFTEELLLFPENASARASLATVYHATGRAAEAAQAIEDLTRFVPTPEGYSIAARLWTSFGGAQQARDLRSESRRLFKTQRESAPASSGRR